MDSRIAWTIDYHMDYTIRLKDWTHKSELLKNQLEEKLVADKVADEIDHVNTVMLTGFYHAYGPVNNFFD